jgi:transcriptional regulator with XRE-family HTH domain
MTRTAKEVIDAREFYKQGLSVSEVARRTGIPRSTVSEWVHDGFTERLLARGASPLEHPCDPCDAVLNVKEEPYAYLLGLYLGDGCISRHPRTYKLRIVLDQRYPGIIAECGAATAAVLPNRVGHVQCPGCIEVSSYSQHWPCLFPQHGPGVKHKRPIILEPWQAWVAVERHPRLLLRGMIHSDGSRFINRVKRPSGIYEYPRYMFSNRSADIRAIFALACDRAGVECKRTNQWLTAVSKGEHVALMDSFIGPKC